MGRFGISLVLALCVSTPLFAHHEAIFGPQSAMVLTAETYLTAQMFTRQTGAEGDRVQEQRERFRVGAGIILAVGR